MRSTAGALASRSSRAVSSKRSAVRSRVSTQTVVAARPGSIAWRATSSTAATSSPRGSWRLAPSAWLPPSVPGTRTATVVRQSVDRVDRRGVMPLTPGTRRRVAGGRQARGVSRTPAASPRPIRHRSRGRGRPRSSPTPPGALPVVSAHDRSTVLPCATIAQDAAYHHGERRRRTGEGNRPPRSPGRRHHESRSCGSPSAVEAVSTRKDGDVAGWGGPKLPAFTSPERVVRAGGRLCGR
jgi:hypothetical protein